MLTTDGWVKRNLIDPEFTFSHIGFEWLQPLPGNGMYWYFAAMALTGMMVMTGWKYRFAMTTHTLLWTGVYIMQKTSYNNHYYLLVLLCTIMIFLPANANFSIDSRRNPKIRTSFMPAWCRYVFIGQMAIVYTFAAIAKLYPEWMNGTFTGSMLRATANEYGIALFKEHWFHVFIAWAGFAFDLLLVPLLLYKRTRPFALATAVIFHLFNSLTLDIGIFPYLSLAMLLFFLPAETFSLYKNNEPQQPVAGSHNKAVVWLLGGYFALQLFLPLRHHLIKGDVLWTEEGHRLSWRMMLRKRSGYIQFKLKDKADGKEWLYDLRKHLTPLQIKNMQTKPDMIWQTAQFIKKEYRDKGTYVAIYVTSRVSVNKLPDRLLVDPNVDMADTEWDYLFHNNWILTYEWEK